MSKLLRRLGVVLVVLFALIAVAAIAVYATSNRRLAKQFAVQPGVVEVRSDPETIARGNHLASSRGCKDCHGSDLGGARVIEDGAMGTLYGSNLTRGKGTAVSGFQDVDWVRAIRHGVGSDGRPLILMPSAEYSQMRNADLGAIIAYMKSLPPVDRDTVPVKLGPVARALILAGKFPISAEIIDHAHVQPATVAPGVTVEYGKYLAQGCIGCHNTNFSGGKIDVGPPDWPPAANLTQDPAGRINSWSEADFIKALRTGHRPDGTEISSVMPRSFGQMDDTELKAIWLFLKSLPAKPTGQK